MLVHLLVSLWNTITLSFKPPKYSSIMFCSIPSHLSLTLTWTLSLLFTYFLRIILPYACLPSQCIFELYKNVIWWVLSYIFTFPSQIYFSKIYPHLLRLYFSYIYYLVIFFWWINHNLVSHLLFDELFLNFCCYEEWCYRLLCCLSAQAQGTWWSQKRCILSL